MNVTYYCPDCRRKLVGGEPFIEDDLTTKVIEFKTCECGEKWALVYNEEKALEQLVRR